MAHAPPSAHASLTHDRRLAKHVASVCLVGTDIGNPAGELGHVEGTRTSNTPAYGNAGRELVWMRKAAMTALQTHSTPAAPLAVVPQFSVNVGPAVRRGLLATRSGRTCVVRGSFTPGGAGLPGQHHPAWRSPPLVLAWRTWGVGRGP